MIGTVISLFDHSGNAVRDWANAGYTCYCLDILHPAEPRTETSGNGTITYLHADLNADANGWELVEQLMSQAAGHRVMFAWPPCDDLAVSGNRHWAAKARARADFQEYAARRATKSAEMADKHGFAWMVENPVGRLSTLWRKPDFIWNPCNYGGYLPENDVHPEWPYYIAPRDAYTKKTGAWIGGGFKMPPMKPVDPEILVQYTASGRKLTGSRQFFRLGGKSAKTKQIRNLGPRGACKAFFLANCKQGEDE